jgi:hypothetical protein
VTTSPKRLQELRARALAANVETINDPDELARRGMRAHLVEIGALVPPDRPEVAVRLHGPGVPDHEVPVREVTGILSSLQEALASIGQALRHEPTVRGAIQASIQRATELFMSPVIAGGSVVFHLAAAGERVTGDEAVELTGTDTLVDAAMGELFTVFERSEAHQLDSAALARDLRRLGPRTAKHLSDLVKRVTDDEIDIDLSWRNPQGTRREASLQQQAALTLGQAIDRNKVEVKMVQMRGKLATVSSIAKADLLTDSGERIKMAVDTDIASALGPYYNQRVIVRVEQTTVWSTSTGKETRTFSLVSIQLAEDETGVSEEAKAPGGDSPRAPKRSSSRKTRSRSPA